MRIRESQKHTDPTDPDSQQGNKVFQRMLSCGSYNIDKYEFHFSSSDKCEFDFSSSDKYEFDFFSSSADHIQKEKFFYSVLNCVTFSLQIAATVQ